ncbi:Carminomycin 4-O-methyltransferase [Luteitalea pratensis]|uniref:Carminomycin 4-O-methyltransferase n=1 Tax=Luteitalea pratensis TaxID=1855912 RepID=A0A143PMC1_LUTPR|nr:methyltransferase [Luteitalea pratensis]AMY08919.1 Carminomycin 4-O-methyltransferase [Luteitalea pratensis]
MPLDLLAPPATSPLSLYRYRDGLYAADLLTTALVEFDLFTWLDAHPSTLAGVCARFGFHARPADVMLTLFVARGYVERDGEVFRVSAVGREHLTAGSPWYLAPYFGALKERPFVQDFARVLRTGQPANWGGARSGQDWHVAMQDETFARRFTAAMDCRGLYLGEALARAVDLSNHHHVLDIGGGSGIYACALAARHPHLRGTVLDQAPVAPIATTLIADRGLGDRIDVVAADFFSEALPAGHDVHLFSNVLHDWDTPEVGRLLSASFASLAPGGLLLIHDAFITADKTGPIAVAEYSVLLMHASQGRCYATSEYEEMLRATGFVDYRYQDTVADRGVMTARRP